MRAAECVLGGLRVDGQVPGFSRRRGELVTHVRQPSVAARLGTHHCRVKVAGEYGGQRTRQSQRVA